MFKLEQKRARDSEWVQDGNGVVVRSSIKTRFFFVPVEKTIQERGRKAEVRMIEVT